MLGVLFLILTCVIKKYPKDVLIEKKGKLKEYLFFNWTIRLYMETYLNLCLFSLINLKEIRWDVGFPAVKTSNFFSFLIFTQALVVPFVIFSYYIRNRDRWEDEDFQTKFGPFLDGLKHDKKHQVSLLVM